MNKHSMLKVIQLFFYEKKHSCILLERRIQQHLQRVSQNIRSFSKDVRHLKPDLASKLPFRSFRSLHHPLLLTSGE